MGEIIISTAKMEDAEELNRIECAAFPSAEAASLESYKYRITNINDWFLKAEEDGKIVGLICCRPVAIEGVTDDMYEPEPVADGKVICILSVATEPSAAWTRFRLPARISWCIIMPSSALCSTAFPHPNTAACNGTT